MSTTNVPNTGPPAPAGHMQGQTAAPHQQQQQQPLDSVSRVRSLLWQLKEVLSVCFFILF